MCADIRFAFTFGHPNYRRLDGRQTGLWCELDHVFRTQDTAWRKVTDALVLADRNRNGGFCGAKFSLLLPI